MVLLFVLGIAFGPLAGDWWVQRQLDADLARLRAAGEPVVAADLWGDPVSDDRNASLDYKAAGPLIDERRPAWDRWNHSQQGDYRIPLTPAERETVQSVVADNGPALARVAAAREKVCGPWRDSLAPPYLAASRQFDLNAVRRLASLLKLATLSAHSDGDDRRALAYLLDLCRLGDSAEWRPTLGGHMVAVGIWAVAIDTVGLIAPDLQVDAATRPQADELIARLLDDRGARAGQRLAWASERIIDVTWLRGVAAGRVVDAGPASPRHVTLQGYIDGPLVLSDARVLSDFLEQLTRAGRAADWPAARQLMPTALERRVEENHRWHPFASVLLPGLRFPVLTEFKCLAARRLAAVAVAIRLFVIDHGGRRPASLAELAPAELPPVPPAPMSGGTLRYHLGGTDPRVYSIGENGVDNGGIEPGVDAPYAKRKELDDLVVHLTHQPRPATRPG
jgi:hypothetical protein